jgi:hypothetical protein
VPGSDVSVDGDRVIGAGVGRTVRWRRVCAAQIGMNAAR